MGIVRSSPILQPSVHASHNYFPANAVIPVENLVQEVKVPVTTGTQETGSGMNGLPVLCLAERIRRHRNRGLPSVLEEFSEMFILTLADLGEKREEMIQLIQTKL